MIVQRTFCQKLTGLQFKELERHLNSTGTLAALDRIFIGKNKPEVEVCMNSLEKDAVTVATGFAQWKQCFYLLSDEVNVQTMSCLLR